MVTDRSARYMKQEKSQWKDAIHAKELTPKKKEGAKRQRRGEK